MMPGWMRDAAYSGFRPRSSLRARLLGVIYLSEALEKEDKALKKIKNEFEEFKAKHASTVSALI